MNLRKEPAIIISTVVAIIVGAIATISGNGFISEALAGQATDIVNSLGQLLLLLAPVIAGIFVRSQVYSPATVQTAVSNAAATGSSTITVTPP